MRFTSSGVTKSRPAISAAARAARDERDAAARAGARRDAAPGARRAHDAHGVVEHRVVDRERRGDRLQREHGRRA